MSLYFNNCGITINNSGLLAENASYSCNNGLVNINLLGYKDGFNKGINGPLQTTFNTNYIVETSNEPIFNICQFLSTGYDNFNFEPTSVVAGGISGQLYLQSYNISLKPNEIVRANANFIGFSQLSGSFTPQNQYFYQGGASNGAYTARFLNYESTSSVIIYDFSYQFDASWNPEYILGQTNPLQVQLNQKNETIKFTTDYFTKNHYTGVNLNEFFNNSLHGIDINSTGNGRLRIMVTGYTVKNDDIKFDPDNLAFQTITLIK